MKRRTRGLLTALVLCALGGVVFAACGEKEEPHTHQWGEWQITTPAGCETEGVKERSCSGCSEKETDTIAKKGHEWNEWQVTTPAGCETDGVKERTCKNCTEKQTDTIEKTGHEWNEWQVTTPAGCETDGVKERTCKNCTEKQTDTVAQTGHSWDAGRVTVQPTYAKDGAKEFTCQNSDCEETKTETVERLGFDKKTEACWESKSIKVLAIGNSQTDDLGQYLSDILHAAGFTNVTVAWAWISGGSLESIKTAIEGDTASFIWEYQNEGDATYTRAQDKVKLDVALAYAEWDFVLVNTRGFGQGAADLGLMTPEQLDCIVTKVIEGTEGNACPVWYTGNLYRGDNENYTGSASGSPYTSRDDHYEKAVAMIKERVVTERDWQAVIPSATAVHNYSSVYSDSVLYRDSGHLSYPVGCVIAGIACAAVLAPQADLDALKLSFVSDAMLEDIKAAVASAIEHPWERTPLSVQGTAIDGYTVRHGSFEESGNGFRSLSEQSLIEGEGSVPAGEISFRLACATLGWNGAVFALTPGGASYWESGASYYFAGISEHGTAMLVKVDGTSSSVWNVLATAPMPAADEDGTYEMTVKFKAGKIALEVNGELVLGYTDASPLTGTAWGFRAEHRATFFNDIEFVPNDDIEVPEPPATGVIEGWTARRSEFIYDKGAKAYTAFGENALLQRDEDWQGGTVTFDFTMGAPADAGVLFGLDAGGKETFWEDAGVSYYMAAVTRTGGVGFAAVNLSEGKAWTWLTEPANNVIQHFALDETYTGSLAWNPSMGLMQFTIGGVSVSCSDATLAGRGFGLRAGQAGNTWANLTFTDELPTFPGSEHGIRIVSGDWEVGTDENGKKSFTNTVKDSLFLLTGVNVEKLVGDVTVEFDFKSKYVGSDVQGVVFGWNAATVTFAKNHTVVGKILNAYKLGLCSFWDGHFQWWTPGTVTGQSSRKLTDETKTYAIKVVWHRTHDASTSPFDIYLDGTLVENCNMRVDGYTQDENFTCIGFTSGKSDKATAEIAFSQVTYSNIRINGTEI